MTLRKLDGELPLRHMCVHPEHEIPRHIVLTPGEYEHQCPACYIITRFRVDEPGQLHDVSPRRHG